MKVPFVSFKPLESELDRQLRDAFERVYNRSWYTDGEEDKQFLMYGNCSLRRIVFSGRIVLTYQRLRFFK